MGRPNEVKGQFATLLESALTEHFGRPPSNASVAREFNLRAYNVEPVTQESVRRWRKGISMPEERKLRILVFWLNLDLKLCFQTSLEDSTLHALNGSNSAEKPAQNAHRPRLGSDALQLLRLIDLLPNSDRQLIELLARKLSGRSGRHT